MRRIHTRYRAPTGLVAIVLLVAIALSAPAATAATKPSNGLIAFSGKRSGSRVIYTRQPNGTRLRVIPIRGRADFPAFSPRGRRLAVTRYAPGRSRIWIEHMDGTGLRPLTTGPADTMAAWAPDATGVAFARGPKGRRDVYRVFADGAGLKRLTRSVRNDEAPTWSVRQRVAFVRRSSKSSDIYSVSAGGGRARRLTRSPDLDLDPAWSPSGRTLVYSKGRRGHRDLYLLTANGRHRRRLSAVRGDEGEPTFSPDGTRISFTHTHAGKRRLYLFRIKGKPIKRLPGRGRRVRRLSSAGSASNAPTWQPRGLDPVIAAAGDIACDPASPSFNNGVGRRGVCRQRLSSDQLLRMDLSQVLTVGDEQYERGGLDAFLRSFDPSWGRVKALIRPVPGNHEYLGKSGAAGYFDYFNGVGVRTGPAGDRAIGGYYSYDVGSWHVIALNSECGQIPGGCGPSSTQTRWLRADLATHPVACTLAYFHGPLFTSGRYTNESADVRPFWQALHDAGADVVLSGHDHVYERFAPQTPAGAPDPARGIRAFNVGVGGRGPHEFVGVSPNSELRIDNVVGAIQLTLGQGRYDWRLVRAPTGAAADSGSARCH